MNDQSTLCSLDNMEMRGGGTIASPWSPRLVAATPAQADAVVRAFPAGAGVAFTVEWENDSGWEPARFPLGPMGEGVMRALVELPNGRRVRLRADFVGHPHEVVRFCVSLRPRESDRKSGGPPSDTTPPDRFTSAEGGERE